MLVPPKTLAIDMGFALSACVLSEAGSGFPGVVDWFSKTGGWRMRVRVLALVGLMAASAAFAKDASPDNIKGLYLTTDFPVVQLRAGEETTVPLKIYNYGLKPQRTALTMTGAPADWKPSLEGSGKPASAAFVDYDGNASLNLKFNIPATAKPGVYQMTVNAEGEDGKSTLPITINLAEPLAAKLTVTPKFPVLKGSPKSNFDFNVAVKNEASADTTVTLRAEAPAGFTTTFKEGYNTQEITSLLIKANESKDISVGIKPAPNAKAGQTPVKLTIASDKATVATDLTLDIAGQPTVSISGQDERLSGEATAGLEKSFPLVIRNSGTAPARAISFNGTAPSGWTVKFDPKDVTEIAANGEAKVNALITPNAKAIAGDYVVSLRASGEGVSESASYRVTVTTSTLWGVTGVGVIAVALLVLFGAVGRFGRR
jgi:uncharacterized membrane protein